MSKLDIEGEYVPCGGTFYKHPIPINRETSMVLVRKASHCVLVYLALQAVWRSGQWKSACTLSVLSSTSFTWSFDRG